MSSVRTILLASLIFCGAFAAPHSLAETQGAPHAEDAEISTANVKAFDEAWETVRTSFYDRKREWDALARKYRPLAAQPGANAARVINDMLAELRASHTGYYSPDEVAYYDLADIFSYGLRRDLRSRFPDGNVAYVGLGMATRVIDGRYFISGIFEDFPAAQAKLLLGDEIIAVDGSPFEPVRSFTGKAGQKVKLTIRREAKSEPRVIDVVPRALHPDETYLAAMENGARLIEKGNRKLAYVHVWSYAGEAYQELLERLLVSGKLKDADALIWDLRDGWGGAQPHYLDIFDPRSPTMTLTGADAKESIVNGRWRKPVILLINGGTRSGKEILAYGFRKYGYGQIVGSRSAGAVLAGRAFMQSNGNLLLVAVADVTVENGRLEGTGVSPDHEVPFDIRYAKGADPQLDAATDILLRQLDQAVTPP